MIGGRGVGVVAVAVAAALGLPAVASGAGASYVVVQCDPQNRALADMGVREQRGYEVVRRCDDPGAENSLHIDSALSRAETGKEGRVSWRAPSGTGFVAIRLQAKLRRDSGHRSLVYMADAGARETRRLGAGTGDPSPFRALKWDGGRQAMFAAALRCGATPHCQESGPAKTWVRNLRMRIADFVDPEVSVAGSLVSSGWKRGVHQLTFGGEDAGAGLRDVVVKVNGVVLTSAQGSCPGLIPGTALASRLQPCSEGSTVGDITTDSVTPPFHEGTNAVSVCARDFPGNLTCATRTVAVDNVAPSLAFTSAQDPDDPELIQAVASDQHSGVAGGQIFYRAAGQTIWQPLPTQLASGALRARVDSTAVPPGAYRFRAVATDVAGNQIETTRRIDGLEKQLEFPLKAGVNLNARLEPGGAKRTTIGYGKRSKVAGVLRAASGEPLANQAVVIVENFGDGALIRERISQAETDAQGRWSEPLPAGPSRRVVATYPGTQRYLPAETVGGQLNVRTKASLRASKARVREGGRVVFRGRLGRLGARIPTGGKLLELQVKQDTRTYQTVGQGFRSNSNGGYRIPYRFGNFYQYDVRFQFRVRVAREADWPYKAPIRSKAERVTVLDR